MQVTPYQPLRTGPMQERGRDDSPLQSRIVAAPGTEVMPLPQTDAGARQSATVGAAPQPAHKGLPAWDPGRQQRVTTIRQARDYLSQMGDQLLRLKRELGDQLARASSGVGIAENAAPAVDETLARIDQLWRQRAQATGQALDGQLDYSGPGEARQIFRVRGLDARALASGQRETLTLSVSGLPGGMAALALDPSRDVRDNARQLERALRAADIVVGLDERGEPVFSVPESRWPSVRDSLSIQGEGQRFPAGGLHRVKTDAEPDALRPAQWRVASHDMVTLRRVLQEVMRAIDRVKQAQRQVSQMLAEAVAELARAVEPQEGARHAAFAQRFESLGGAPRYDTYMQVAPALIGISRERVVALLGAGF